MTTFASEMSRHIALQEPDEIVVHEMPDVFRNGSLFHVIGKEP